MSAVINTATEPNPEDVFFDAQLLPPQERGVTFKARYFGQLQLVTNRIHETEKLTRSS